MNIAPQALCSGLTSLGSSGDAEGVEGTDVSFHRDTVSSSTAQRSFLQSKETMVCVDTAMSRVMYDIINNAYHFQCLYNMPRIG